MVMSNQRSYPSISPLILGSAHGLSLEQYKYKYISSIFFLLRNGRNMQNVQNYAQCANLPKLQNMFLTLCDSWSNAEVGQRKCQNLSWQHIIKVVVIIVVPLKALSIKIISSVLPCRKKLFVAVAKVPFPHQMSWIPTCLRKMSLIIISIIISISVNAHQY